MALIAVSAVRTVKQLPITFSAIDLCHLKPVQQKFGVLAFVQPKRPLVTGWILPVHHRASIVDIEIVR